MMGGRHVLLEEIIDRTMLGGFIVEASDVVLDASLEGQLEQMRHHLGQTNALETWSRC
jgi:F0F1-type ATP synthase delta subunit